MPEWWSYSLSDFLLFSPRTYYRLLQRYNEGVWPAHIMTAGLGLGILALVWRRPSGSGRIVSGILAALWSWVAVAFLWKRYTTINWAATYILPLFALEILLLLWIGVVRNRLTYRLSHTLPSVAGGSLLAFSVAAYPGLAPLLGRGWRQAEVFGLAPDPTVIGTAGLLLLSGQFQWKLGVVPLAWCLFSGLTLWAMQSPEAILMGLAALTFIAVAGSRGQWQRSS